METIKLELDEQGNGALRLYEGAEAYAWMDVSLSGSELTVYHTEVIPKAEGRGFAKRLLEELVKVAREAGWKIVPLCPFVQAQFKRSPDAYADIWKR